MDVSNYMSKPLTLSLYFVVVKFHFDREAAVVRTHRTASPSFSKCSLFLYLRSRPVVVVVRSVHVPWWCWWWFLYHSLTHYQQILIDLCRRRGFCLLLHADRPATFSEEEAIFIFHHYHTIIGLLLPNSMSGIKFMETSCDGIMASRISGFYILVMRRSFFFTLACSLRQSCGEDWNVRVWVSLPQRSLPFFFCVLSDSCLCFFYYHQQLPFHYITIFEGFYYHMPRFCH